MKKTLIFIALLYFPMLLWGQSSNSQQYEAYMQQGEMAFKKGDFDKAVTAYLNAMRGCNEIPDSINHKMLQVIDSAKSVSFKSTIFLDLRSQDLGEIPPSVFQQTALKVLLVGGNKLRKIPEGLKSLVNLRYLDVSENQISKIENLENLKSLQYFDISENQITKLEGLDSLKTLLRLYISDNQITKLEGLDSLRALLHLSISSNQITKLEGLTNLKSLQYFNIGFNQITKLEGLTNLTSLRSFFILFNQITKLEGLTHLTSLQYFNIYGNQITKLEDLDNLNALQYFYIGSNQITELEGLAHLKNIKTLDINDNPLSIAAINQGLKMLPNIEELSMGDLGLRALPDVVFSLKHLKYLNLAGLLYDKNNNYFSKEKQASIKKLLPNCEIIFD